MNYHGVIENKYIHILLARIYVSIVCASMYSYKYFISYFSITGRNSLRTNIEELPRGRHMFPFQWPIPEDLPCSYEGPYGWVRYHAQCALLHPCCKPGCHTSLTSRVFFTVIRQMDLNAEDDWNVNLSLSLSLSLSCVSIYLSIYLAIKLSIYRSVSE